jgi:hypothetical protein
VSNDLKLNPKKGQVILTQSAGVVMCRSLSCLLVQIQ